MESLPPGGPLGPYRSQATFDWYKFRNNFFTEEIVRFKQKIWQTLEQDPEFVHSEKDQTLEENRDVTFRKAMQLVMDPRYEFMDTQNLLQTPHYISVASNALGMYDWSVNVRKGLLREFCISAINGAGTKDHDDIMRSLYKSEVKGCFCLTEMSHGTDSKSIRSTATFHPDTQEFVFHTPDFEAAKCWSGNLGKTATHAIVFAQLITPEGASRGMHSFVIPIRDVHTMEPFPGVTIGDMGHKVGLNGVDNGFMMFNQYRVPKKCLLNKHGDVTPDGRYATPYKDPKKRFGASLGNLSGGRVSIISMTTTNLHKATVIAVRYSASRKQFSDNGVEQPVIEYQMQQCRLFPYLAAAYVHHVFGTQLNADFINFNIMKMSKKDPTVLAQMGQEIHAISCAGKAVTSWVTQQGIQECREACGGHGYLSVSGFGSLRDDNDANCTYEGDNNVLLQQTSNFLLANLSEKNNAELLSPLGALDVLKNCDEILKKHVVINEETLGQPETYLALYGKLVLHLLDATNGLVTQLAKDPKRSALSIKNDSQFFMARTLSIAFLEMLALRNFLRGVQQKGTFAHEERAVLRDLGALYGVSRLLNHASHFRESGLLQGKTDVRQLQNKLIELCLRLKPNAVALVDVLAPTDFVLNSALGASNGMIYDNLQKAFYSRPECFSKAGFWKHVVQSKL